MTMILKPNTVTQGDSLVLVPGLQDACVDMCLSDWPYEVYIAKWDITLDSFGGAGSTAVGAMKRGRTASLVEIDPVHVATARGRIEAERRGQSYADYVRGQGALFGGARDR